MELNSSIQEIFSLNSDMQYDLFRQEESENDSSHIFLTQEFSYGRFVNESRIKTQAKKKVSGELTRKPLMCKYFYAL